MLLQEEEAEFAGSKTALEFELKEAFEMNRCLEKENGDLNRRLESANAEHEGLHRLNRRLEGEKEELARRLDEALPQPTGNRLHWKENPVKLLAAWKMVDQSPYGKLISLKRGLFGRNVRLQSVFGNWARSTRNHIVRRLKEGSREAESTAIAMSEKLSNELDEERFFFISQE